jgi:molybdopterin molybdotransferase
MPPSSEPAILSFEEARHLVEQHAGFLTPHGRESVDLLAAAGRVLAETIHADRDFPPFPRSTRDGYAVRSEDLRTIPATLRVVGEIKAGAKGEIGPVEPGEAVSIMTGAPVPHGADAVVMLEWTSSAGDRIQVQRGVAAGENIVPTGSEGKKGEPMLAAGTRIDFAAIAVAAAVGRRCVAVYSKPRIAVLSTGDEVVDVESSPEPNEIRNSNSYSLAAQIANAGGEPVLMPIAPDEPKRLRQLLRQGLESDLLLIAGGVSMGRYDLVEQELAALGAKFLFTGAPIQPGKPVVFGNIPDSSRKYFVGLPGNPVSTMVCFELFARPLVDALSGIPPRKLVFVHARLKKQIKTKPGLKRFLPAQLSGEFEHSEVELVRWQGSGDIAAVVRSNCFIVIPPDRERIEPGEWVPVLLR